MIKGTLLISPTGGSLVRTFCLGNEKTLADRDIDKKHYVRVF